MKILFVASDTIPHAGGKSSHVLDLMDGLRVRGVESGLVSFGTLTRKAQLLMKSRHARHWFTERAAFDQNVAKAWGRTLNKLVIQECRTGEYDCISAQDASAASSVSAAADKLGVPTVLTMHTYFGLESTLDGRVSSDSDHYRASLDRELEALRSVSEIVAVDERIQNHVLATLQSLPADQRRLGRPPSVSAISNFVNVATYVLPTAQERVTARARLGIGGEEFVASCVRRLVEKNGVIDAVRAFGSLPSNTKLLVAGDGPQRQPIMREVESLGLGDRVVMLGSVDSAGAREVYAASDISIVPSITANGLQEATSISALEAMAMGIPTVASNIGGLRQMIDNGRTGILVEERSPEAIAAATLGLLYDPELRRKVGVEARRYAEAAHSHVGAADMYLEVFRRAVNGTVANEG